MTYEYHVGPSRSAEEERDMKHHDACRRWGWASLACGLVLSGCATEPDITQDPDFGNSVRHMIALQTADPGSGGTGLDGEKARNTLRTYREHIGDPKRVEQDQLIDIKLD
jgi:hypothetical protein